jgi:hypothetical protein
MKRLAKARGAALEANLEAIRIHGVEAGKLATKLRVAVNARTQNTQAAEAPKRARRQSEEGAGYSWRKSAAQAKERELPN